MDYREFRQALKDAGLTQAELARRLDMTPRNVNRWARDVVPVPSYVPLVLKAIEAEKREPAELP